MENSGIYSSGIKLINNVLIFVFSSVKKSIFIPYNTLLPLAVSLNFAPNNSAALLHINILPKNISKYSYIILLIN